MKNITFYADENLIKRARQAAHNQGETLNAIFREWLEEFVFAADRAKEAEKLMKRLRYVKGRRFTRDEMNAR